MQPKKITSRIFAVMLSAAMMIPAAQAALPTVYASSYDGWDTYSANTQGIITDTAKDVFELAAASYSGETLVPLCCYATQVVAGTNYYYICRQGSDLKKVCVYYRNNESAAVSSVEDFNLNDYTESYQYDLSDYPAPGSLEMYFGPAVELSGQAKTVFDQRFENIAGVSYEPIACLGSRINNSLTEYAYMVRTSVVVPNPDYYLTVMIIKVDNEGDLHGMTSHEILGRKAEIPDDGRLSYQFTGNESSKAGYAEGRITLNADASGTYKLYWADNQKALDGYYPIGTLKLSSGASGSVKLGYHTAIPAGATKVIATTGSLNTSDAYSVYNIPYNKRLSSVSGKELYTFSSYSDIHIDKRSGEPFWKRAESNLKKAFNLSAEKNADYIVVSGDCVTCSDLDAEWKTYQKILSDSDYVNPVWESNGNHDLKAGVSDGLKKFIKATGTDGSTNPKSYYSMAEDKTGDIFIFMSLELSKDPNKAEVFSNDQINWVKSIIEDNYGARNIFLVEHAPVKGYCAGDRLNNPYYGGLMDSSYGNNGKFKKLLKDYPQITFLSGHTHEDFSMNYNYFDDNGGAANMIHTPALAGSTIPKNDSELDYSNGNSESCQGYFVQVFENEIVFNGLSVTEDRIFPQYSYIMEGSRTSQSEVSYSPSEITLSGTEVDAAEMLSNVASILSRYYTYSSYDRYQALKRLYYKYKGSQKLDENIIKDFEDKINSLSLHTGPINFNSVGNTYYFTNNKKWSSVYAYAWTGSSKNASWPGVKLSKVGTNSYNEDIYEVKFNSAGEFQNIIFNSGSDSAKTVDIALSDYSENGFYISGGGGGKYTVKNYYYNNNSGSEPVSSDSISAVYYISDEHNWSDAGFSLTCGADGKYRATYTAASDKTFSFSLYNKTSKKYVCVPESVKFTFEKGLVSSNDVSVMSSRGKSITVYGMAENDQLDIVYDPAKSKVSVTCVNDYEELVNNSRVNSDKLSIGSRIYITADAEGGDGNYTYKYSYKRHTARLWTEMGSGLITATGAFFTPRAVADFDIKITVTDGNGSTAEVIRTVSIVDGKSTAFSNNSTINKVKAVPGTRIIVTAAADGSFDYKYAYYYKRSTAGVWTIMGKEFGSDAAVAFTPRAEGKYQVKVDIMDGNGELVSKIYDLTITSDTSDDPVNNSTISATNVTAGSRITINGAASGGAGGYTYTYQQKKSTARVWNTIAENTTAESVSFLLRTAGTVEVKVTVTDKAGANSEKIFTVSVT